MAPSVRKRYPSDLTETEWALIEPLVPAVKSGGRPARWSRREIVNAIFYMARAGGSWRQLPHDLPPWQTVYDYFRTWRRDGTLETIHAQLRERLRRRLGRAATPSAGIVDSQSTKTTEKGDLPAASAMTRARR